MIDSVGVDLLLGLFKSKIMYHRLRQVQLRTQVAKVDVNS